jgi:hypothetical protein
MVELNLMVCLFRNRKFYPAELQAYETYRNQLIKEYNEVFTLDFSTSKIIAWNEIVCKQFFKFIQNICCYK